MLTAMLFLALFGGADVIDLTHTFDEQTIYWPNAKPFVFKKDSWGKNASGWWYAAGSYAASEHGGTHLDGPVHFAQGKETVDEIPLRRLMGDAWVIDVSKACDANPDYLVTSADIEAFEKTHGRIPTDAIVLVRTGWSRRWPDKKRYLGSDTPGDTAHLHFPGISEAAAKLLVERKIAGFGIDTASMDNGPSKDFLAHRVFNAANVYGLENLTDLDKLPPVGAQLIALPMKIKGGSGAPVRAIGIRPHP